MEPDKYITVKAQGTPAMKENDRRCKQEHLPVVYARAKTKYAQVEMDLIYVPGASRYNEDEAFKEDVLTACARALGHPRKSVTALGLLTVVRDVPIEKAEPLMLEFLAIYEHYRQDATISRIGV